ncbi:MAG: GNAT family N-acetyltransferase [Oscillospiraceae bacterium]
MIYRKLKLSEIISVHKKHMRKDFRREEIKPLIAVIFLVLFGRSECIGAFENGVLASYAIIVKSKSCPYILLDYLAVVGDRRGEGIGGKMLDHLQKRFGGIIIEVENPDFAANASAQTTMERRIAFYIKNGFVMTDVLCNLFTVEMNIMMYGPALCSDEVLFALDSLYSAMFTKSIRKKHVFLRKVS